MCTRQRLQPETKNYEMGQTQLLEFGLSAEIFKNFTRYNS